MATVIDAERCNTDAADSPTGSGVRLLPTPYRIDLKTLDDVRVEMARVYRDMRTGRIESQDGTRLVYVLAQIGKIIEAGDVEKRVEALETVLKARRLPR
jgi:uncharacterized protein YjhX (UPF0386 family)